MTSITSRVVSKILKVHFSGEQICFVYQKGSTISVSCFPWSWKTHAWVYCHFPLLNSNYYKILHTELLKQFYNVCSSVKLYSQKHWGDQLRMQKLFFAHRLEQTPVTAQHSILRRTPKHHNKRNMNSVLDVVC